MPAVAELLVNEDACCQALARCISDSLGYMSCRRKFFRRLVLVIWIHTKLSALGHPKRCYVTGPISAGFIMSADVLTCFLDGKGRSVNARLVFDPKDPLSLVPYEWEAFQVSRL